MGMAENVATLAQLLRRRKIVRISVDELSRLNILERHCDIERGVCLDCLKVKGRHKF
jgi:hypothetical protein